MKTKIIIKNSWKTVDEYPVFLPLQKGDIINIDGKKYIVKEKEFVVFDNILLIYI